MFDLESLKIDLKALKESETKLKFGLDDEYFQAIDAADVHRGNVDVDLLIRQTGGFYELLFHIEGIVHIPCDRCLEDMEQSVSTDNKLVAKFGEENSEDDDLVTVAEDEGILDVAWFIYEFIDLNIPIKHVHAPGKCNPAMIRMLEEHTVARSDEEEGNKAMDPRWEALLKLKKE